MTEPTHIPHRFLPPTFCKPESKDDFLEELVKYKEHFKFYFNALWTAPSCNGFQLTGLESNSHADYEQQYASYTDSEDQDTQNTQDLNHDIQQSQAINCIDLDTKSYNIFSLSTNQLQQKAQALVTISMDNTQINVLPDSGAQVNTIPVSLVPEQCFKLFRKSNITIKPYNSDPIKPIAEFTTEISWNNHKAQATFIVLDDHNTFL